MTKNGFIEDLKKIDKKDVIMKHDLQVFVRRRDPKRMRIEPIERFSSFK